MKLRLQNNTDVALAFGLVIMLALMLIPLPPSFLDFFLSMNITLAMLILVISLSITKPLDLSIFPSLLLILTLFRLSLNISSTRLILLNGYAGKVIESFGTFVVGGNYVVGFIVFIILVIIQFIVIVKGSERISEVSARFTLDAMPGKQMAIDADLNTGLITEDEARERREKIAREAEFFGAMDGATKFVKGDAIAGLLINVINILGGFIIGVAIKGMPFTEAIKTYTILTIGDGLVSQIPALIIAVSAGMVVTRSSAGTPLDFQIKTQLLTNPKTLAIVAGIVFLVAFVPGMPMVPFFIISAVLASGSYFKMKAEKQPTEPEIAEEAPEEQTDNVEQYLQVDPIEIEIGYALISLINNDEGGDIFEKIASTRKFLALEYGVLIPPVRVRDNLQLEPNEYIFKIKGNVVSRYEIYTDRYLAMNPGNAEDDIEGIPTKDPAFNLPAKWVSDKEKEKAEMLGYTVVDALSVISTHLQETLKKNFDKILTRQAVKQLLENLKKEYPAVVEDINPEVLPLGTIQKVLQNLLREGIPIKDLVQIIESLIDYSKASKNIDVLTEYVRHSLSDVIANLYADENNMIHAIAIGDRLENYIVRAIQEQSNNIQSLGLTPDMYQSLMEQLKSAKNTFEQYGYIPVLLTQATIRPYLWRFIHPAFPDFAVLSYTELPNYVEIELLDKIEVE